MAEGRRRRPGKRTAHVDPAGDMTSQSYPAFIELTVDLRPSLEFGMTPLLHFETTNPLRTRHAGTSFVVSVYTIYSNIGVVCCLLLKVIMLTLGNDSSISFSWIVMPVKGTK